MNVRTVIAALVFLVAGAVGLAIAGAHPLFLVGAISAFCMCFIMTSSMEGRKRDAGVSILAILAACSLAVGMWYLFSDNTAPLAFALGLTIGGLPGALFGWSPNQPDSPEP